MYSTAPTSAPAETPPPASKPSGHGTAKVSLDRKGRGGKSVTVVRGLDLPAAELDTLGKALRRACGAGGTTKDGTIEIQGDHRETVLSRLEALGYRAKRAGG